MKRSIQTIDNTNNTNKKIKFGDNYYSKNNYIDSSSFVNYMLDIPIFDYLAMYNYEKESDAFNDNIRIQSNLHYNYRIVALKRKCVNMNYYFDDLTDYKNRESVDLTMQMIKEKVQVIFNGCLRCDKMRLFTHFDVLIHSNIICDFLDIDLSSQSQQFAGYYQLLIVYNNNRDQKKNNVILYGKQKILDSYFSDSSPLSFDAKFTQPRAFILSNTNIIYSIDLNQQQLFYKMNEAYKWIWDLRENGRSWDLFNPTRHELLPNMKHGSTYGYKRIIQSIISKNDELTSYNDITLEKRNDYFIRQLSVNEALCESNKPFLKSIVDLRGTKKVACDLSKLVVPKKRIFYVDFEYINSFHFKRDFSNADTNHLYLIGVLYEKDGSWLYKAFVPIAIDYMNPSSSYEVQNIRDWVDFMESFGMPYCVMNWSVAEQSMLSSLSKQYNFELETTIEWIDLLKLFKTTIHFVCDGMKTYSLKDVAKSMYKLGLINTSWNDNVMNGLEANILLIPNFIKGDYVLEMCDSLSDIIDYNEIDCRVMMELFEFVVSIKQNKNNSILFYGDSCK
jgi:hypothetical protein